MSQSSERVKRILDFVNANNDSNRSEPKQTVSEPVPTTPVTEPASETVSEPAPTTTAPVSVPIESTLIPNNYDTDKLDSVVSDDKQYNSISRKLRNRKSFPCNVSGFVFNSETDLLAFKQNIQQKRRQFVRDSKAEKIRNTKLQTENLETMDQDETVTENDCLYSTRNPVGFVRNGQAYRIPRTNKKDRTEIYNAISSNKQAMNELIQADNEDRFNEISLNTISNSDTKRKLKNHIDNDIIRDTTWNREEFYRMIEKQIDGNKSTKQTNTRQPKQTRNRNIFDFDDSDESDCLSINGDRLNPNLFSRF